MKVCVCELHIVHIAHLTMSCSVLSIYLGQRKVVNVCEESTYVRLGYK